MSAPAYHPVITTHAFADVILPLATPKAYTYHVPEEWIAQVRPGVRVEVNFGKNKLYTGLVMQLHKTAPEGYRSKPILAVIDDFPIVHEQQFQLWRWIAAYYGCSLGEVMHAALPANFKLTSETRITLGPLFQVDQIQLDDKEYLIAEALTLQSELSIEDIRGILGQKTVYHIIRRLLEKKIIYLQEDLVEKYQPKQVGCVRLAPDFTGSQQKLAEAFALADNAPRQAEALMGYVQLAKKQEFVRRQDLIKLTGVTHSVLNALAKKGVFDLYERPVSRLGGYEEETVDAQELSPQQIRALEEIEAAFQQKDAVLLHGVTGSGKTRVFTELIQHTIDRGGQVLYLLPEIALTTQIIDRLQRIFGDNIAVYHSRLNHNERVELWNQILNGKPAVVGPRSAVLLPFKKLELIIIDEEHDPSYKQHDPNPRYQGRDTAIMLGKQTGAKVLLGTATPSVESYHNAKRGKYGLVSMPERFGGLQLPEIVVVDAKRELIEQKLYSHFTSVLLDELKAALERNEQAILFQNRRGYAPTYRCQTCGWHSECIHCDVSLTYHKFHHTLKCHYCGYSAHLPDTCPACGGKQLTLQGFGTEKIEDELKIFLPKARIARMDLDTVRGKYAHARLINDFEEGKIDILVGTQMVTKGLDFERVGIVGVLSADQLLQFPDFRASERGFQLMLQVAGRAGRKHKQGKVVIQAFNTAHPTLTEVINNDYQTFFQRELQERNEFSYPPFVRLIRITLKHKKPAVVNDAMRAFSHQLKQQLGDWVIGPSVPYVSRVRTYYLLDLLLKLSHDRQKLAFAKDAIRQATDTLHTTDGFSGVRVSVDVDPY